MMIQHVYRASLVAWKEALCSRALLRKPAFARGWALTRTGRIHGGLSRQDVYGWKVSISKDSESPTKKYKISPSSIQPTFFWVKIVSGCFLRAVKVWEEKSEQRPFQLIGCCATGLGGKTAESETTIGIYHQSLSFQVMVCHGIPPLLDLWFSISLFFSLVFGAGRRWWWRWWWWRTAHSTTNSWSSGCHWDRSSNKNTSRFQKPIKKWCTRLQVDWWILFFVPGFLEKTHF